MEGLPRLLCMMQRSRRLDWVHPAWVPLVDNRIESGSGSLDSAASFWYGRNIYGGNGIEADLRKTRIEANGRIWPSNAHQPSSSHAGGTEHVINHGRFGVGRSMPPFLMAIRHQRTYRAALAVLMLFFLTGHCYTSRSCLFDVLKRVFDRERRNDAA